MSISEELNDSAADDAAITTDDASLADWTAFLQDYARGDGPANPVRPPLTPAHLKRLTITSKSDAPVNFEDAPLYSSTSVTPELARTIRDFYCDNGYLPPPRAPWEESRERCILEYDLYSQKQSDHVQSVTDVISAYFPDALVTFSLFRDRIQTHFALSGPKEVIDGFKLHVGLRIPAEDSLCGHAVLLDKRMLFIPDLQADWRYTRNPFGVAGFKSFIGVPVALELDPLQGDVRASQHDGPRRGRIAIGTLNICFTSENIRELSPAQKLVVDRMTSMLEAQLRSTWEGARRSRSGRAATEFTNFIREVQSDGAERSGDRTGYEEDGESRRDRDMLDLIKSLTKKVGSIISEADTVDVLDIRAVSLTVGLQLILTFSFRIFLPTRSISITNPIHFDHSRRLSIWSSSLPLLFCLYLHRKTKYSIKKLSPGSRSVCLLKPQNTWRSDWPIVIIHYILSWSPCQTLFMNLPSPTSTSSEI